MDYDVRVSSDWRCEMGVNGYSQSIVEVLISLHSTTWKIDRLQHTSCGEDSHHNVQVRVFFAHGFVQRFCKVFTAVDVDFKALKS